VLALFFLLRMRDRKAVDKIAWPRGGRRLVVDGLRRNSKIESRKSPTAASLDFRVPHFGPIKIET
jgi:hypothetical protein